jgi:hypothetical protein
MSNEQTVEITPQQEFADATVLAKEHRHLLTQDSRDDLDHQLAAIARLTQKNMSPWIKSGGDLPLSSTGPYRPLMEIFSECAKIVFVHSVDHAIAALSKKPANTL